MRMVLADPARAPKASMAVLSTRVARLVEDMLVQRMQVEQAAAVLAAAHGAFGEGAHLGIGAGQAGAAQERQRRLAIVLHLALLVDLDQAVGGDQDRLMRFVQGQTCRMLPYGSRSARGRGRSSANRPRAGARCPAGQAQVLDAGAHPVFVAIGGVVGDRVSCGLQVGAVNGVGQLANQQDVVGDPGMQALFQHLVDAGVAHPCLQARRPGRPLTPGRPERISLSSSMQDSSERGTSSRNSSNSAMLRALGEARYSSV